VQPELLPQVPSVMDKGNARTRPCFSSQENTKTTVLSRQLEPPFLHDLASELDSAGLIDVEHGNSGTADGGKSLEHCSIPLEVLGPFIGPGMEQANDTASTGAASRDIWTFLVLHRGHARQRLAATVGP
jgi:hypothetical protein